MKAIIDFIRREPVAILGLVSALITLAAAFGFKLLPDQTAAALAVVEILLGFAARSQVTPTASLPVVPDSGIKPSPPGVVPHG